MNTLGDRIRSLREKSGLSQKRLANKLGITNVQLSRYESGDRKPDPETNIFFKDYLDAPEEKREELRKIWEIIKVREAGRKPGDKQGE